MFIKFFAIFSLSLAITLPVASADPVIAAPGVSGTEVADTGSLPFATSSVSGTLDQQVYQEAGGTLDFYYVVSNSAMSLANIGRIAATNFTGFGTIVSYLPSGNVAPTEADRSIPGDTVGFDFQAAGVNLIAPGQLSDFVEISTNATLFALVGTTSISDGGTATVTTYSPVAATPEPVSINLLAAGLAGLALIGSRLRQLEE